MSNQLSLRDEFFIYVPDGIESLNVRLDSTEEKTLNSRAHEAWIKIPLAQRFVVYAHICGEGEKEPLFSC